MKKTRIVFWICTGILSVMLLMASVTDLIPIPEAEEGFRHLGYPLYLLPFLGIARILGIIAIVTPGFPRLKEWAYAGFTFDLIGAIYSGLAVGDPLVYQLPAAIGLMLGAVSYTCYHRLQRNAETQKEGWAAGSLQTA
jgi:uncharacterized membrane protein YphA (DoxX/SURF4 family)